MLIYIKGNLEDKKFLEITYFLVKSKNNKILLQKYKKYIL